MQTRSFIAIAVSRHMHTHTYIRARTLLAVWTRLARGCGGGATAMCTTNAIRATSKSINSTNPDLCPRSAASQPHVIQLKLIPRSCRPVYNQLLVSLSFVISLTSSNLPPLHTPHSNWLPHTTPPPATNLHNH